MPWHVSILFYVVQAATDSSIRHAMACPYMSRIFHICNIPVIFYKSMLCLELLHGVNEDIDALKGKRIVE